MASASSHCWLVARVVTTAALAAPLAACNSRQSALHPAGQEAADVALLFWLMTGAGALIWLIVMGVTIYAVLGRKRPRSERFADRFIIAGGVIFPTVTLAILLVFGLSLLPSWGEDETPDLRIHVSGEQYFWRIGYEQPDGSLVETANEVRLPVGSTAEFVLTSPDVIHSFWIPALGGKMDAIPGRTNVMRLEPTKPGVYRGVCAEFCGPSHALMAFDVRVVEPAEFEAWLAAQAAPARVREGAIFQKAGCAGCHTVRGVSEMSSAGPDLTHFASRRSLGAATLPMTPDNLRRWLLDPKGIKPGVHMPGFAMLGESEMDALVTFLMELR